jgi:hypothetical protein
MASAVLMGTAVTVSAFGAIDPPAPPAPYQNGPLKSPYLAPGLFKSEKAAFAALEGTMQEAEAVIYQGGCAAAAGRTWDIGTYADEDGNGSVDVSSNGVPQLHLDVAASPLVAPAYLGGTKFVTTGLPTNVLNGKKLPLYNGTAYYSKTGQMMTLGASFQVGNINTVGNTNLDLLTGTVIKDFYKLNPILTSTTDPQVPVIFDWGLQSVSKNMVPQDKWWQRSKASRSDGYDAKTVFVKDRLFSDKNNGVCRIKIDMSGANDANGFDQGGTLTIERGAPSAFPIFLVP